MSQTTAPTLAASGGLLGLLVALCVAQVGSLFSSDAWNNVTFVAAEVKNPKRDVPLGILAAMVVATLIYMAVAVTAVSVVPWEELAASKAPLMDVAKAAAPWFRGIDSVYLVITLFAMWLGWQLYWFKTRRDWRTMWRHFQPRGRESCRIRSS